MVMLSALEDYVDVWLTSTLMEPYVVCSKSAVKQDKPSCNRLGLCPNITASLQKVERWNCKKEYDSVLIFSQWRKRDLEVFVTAKDNVWMKTPTVMVACADVIQNSMKPHLEFVVSLSTHNILYFNKPSGGEFYKSTSTSIDLERWLT